MAVGPSGQRNIQRRVRPEELAELVAGYTAGSTACELAQQFGIHRTTVIAHLEREGIPVRRGRGLQPGEIHEATRLYAEGWSAARLSKRFGVSNHTVSAVLRRAGVRIRSRGAAARGE